MFDDDNTSALLNGIGSNAAHNNSNQLLLLNTTSRDAQEHSITAIDGSNLDQSIAARNSAENSAMRHEDDEQNPFSTSISQGGCGRDRDGQLSPMLLIKPKRLVHVNGVVCQMPKNN